MSDGNDIFGSGQSELASRPLDHLAAARTLGECIAPDDIEPLRRLLAASPPVEVAGFLCRLAAGDPELAVAEAAGRWRATGDPHDLDAAIVAVWGAFPRWAAASTKTISDPKGETQCATEWRGGNA